MVDISFYGNQDETLRQLGSLAAALCDMDASVAAGWEGEAGNAFHHQIARLQLDLENVRTRLAAAMTDDAE
jgi:uncharacterized protein YukE